MAQTVKNLLAMQETQVQSLDGEEALKEGNGKPLQYFCLENLMDRGAWQATIRGVARAGHALAIKPQHRGLSFSILVLVTQLSLTLGDPMGCSPPGSSVHGDSPGLNTE